jgi:F-type H+-transporting ATPase subunit a
MLLLQDHGAEHAAHQPPSSIFTPVWKTVKDTEFGRWMGFHVEDKNLGMFWFEAICFTLIGAILLMVLAALATRKYERVPRGIQNVFEWAVGLLRGIVQGFIPGKQGDQYLPYLGTVFLFIFTLNILGVIPAFRSPTMTLSTTAALGITTFIMVQQYAIRATGVVAYVKHFMGDVLWLAPLMFVVEVIGELAKPLSLSLRLFGNIFGEDNVIEQLMGLGLNAYIPVQVPMLLLAIFTSFLQAFIFTTLSTIYIASKVVHEGHGEEHAPHEEQHAHGAHH